MSPICYTDLSVVLQNGNGGVLGTARFEAPFPLQTGQFVGRSCFLRVKNVSLSRAQQNYAIYQVELAAPVTATVENVRNVTAGLISCWSFEELPSNEPAAPDPVTDPGMVQEQSDS